jgi:hypothetical protein
MANWTKKLQLQDLFIMPSRTSIGDEQTGPIFISKNVKQEVAKKWKWFIRWQVWIAYLKIWCKPMQTSKTLKKEH